MRITNKKAQSVSGIIGAVIALGITAICIAIVVYLLFAMNASMGGETVAKYQGNTTSNITQTIMPSVSAVSGTSSWLGLIAVVFLSAIVIGLVMAAFNYYKRE